MRAATYAFEWFARARRQRDPGLGDLRKDPTLTNLKDDPRWNEANGISDMAGTAAR